MLKSPNIPASKITDLIQEQFAVKAAEITFLPIGADFNSAVYRIDSANQAAYFLKLRKGGFNQTAVTLAKFLHDQGLHNIISPLQTRSGDLWAGLDAYTAVLYPYVAGQNGYERPLQAPHWPELGAALKQVHTADYPGHMRRAVRRENYDPQARKTVLSYMDGLDQPHADPLAQELASFLRSHEKTVRDLIGRAAQLAQDLQENPPPFTICHADLHAGNLYIGDEGALYIIDWDEALLAPKERDLMFIGGALLNSGLAAQEEEALFYPAYGPTTVNQAALIYYRCERIIQDLYEFCRQIFGGRDSAADRRQSLRWLKSNFLPGSTIEIALQP